MTKKMRKGLLYGAFILFAVLSIITVLFSLGYNYDFVENKLVKTGSFRVATNVSGAEVYINSHLAGKTSFLTNNFSKGRLLPRTYDIRIQKENYQLWEKNITIGSGLFSDFPVIILIKDEIEPALVSSASANVGPGKTIMTVFDSENRYAYLEQESKSAGMGSVLLLDLNNNAAAQDVLDIPYAVLDRSPVIYDKKLYFLSMNNLISYDPSSDRSSTLFTGASIFYFTDNQIIVAGTKDNVIYSLRPDGAGSGQIIAELPKNYSLVSGHVLGNIHFFILNNGFRTDLFKFESGEWLKIKESISSIKLSPDGKKLIYAGRNELWARWLANSTSQPARIADEEELITRFSQKIDDFAWYKDSEHVFVNTGSVIKFIELDGRGGSRNIFDVSSADGKMVYRNNKLWFFDKLALMVVEL
ncbi:MAG: PEGA domain-containing protein [bacterium]|nr:PEGA domain-containing protein [bacterium]